MRRASRKSSVVGIFVAIVIAVFTLILSSYINYLISIRGEKHEKRIDSLIVRKKNVSSINNVSNINKTLINNLLYSDWPFMHDNLKQTNGNHTVLFTILVCISLLAIILIVIIFFCIYSSKSVPHSTDRKTNNGKQGISVPVGIYTSVMTQTFVDV
jgi:predicted PurR-regulated permease PerM